MEEYEDSYDVDSEVYIEDETIAGISKISILEVEDSQETHEKGLSIRVSNRNNFVRRKLSVPDKRNLEYEAPITTEYIEKLEKDKILHLNTFEKNIINSPQTDIRRVYSCFLIYFLGENGFRSGISETELKNFRLIFNNMINKSENCHEAYFGLGKLNSYIGHYDEAINHFKKALSIKSNEKLYEI